MELNPDALENTFKPESQGKTRLGLYPDGMVEHDGHVGQLLAKLDELGIADNTIVMYSSDNGAEKSSWPDGGNTPYRGEEATNWEGGWRVPCAIRWPGVIKPGTVSNEIFSHQDMLPTLVAAAGEPDIVEKCKKGYKAGKKTFKVHLDGYNMIPYLKGEVQQGPRPGFLIAAGNVPNFVDLSTGDYGTIISAAGKRGNARRIRRPQACPREHGQQGPWSPRTPGGGHQPTCLREPN